MRRWNTDKLKNTIGGELVATVLPGIMVNGRGLQGGLGLENKTNDSSLETYRAFSSTSSEKEGRRARRRQGEKVPKAIKRGKTNLGGIINSARMDALQENELVS